MIVNWELSLMMAHHHDGAPLMQYNGSISNRVSRVDFVIENVSDETRINNSE